MKYLHSLSLVPRETNTPAQKPAGYLPQRRGQGPNGCWRMKVSLISREGVSVAACAPNFCRPDLVNFNLDCQETPTISVHPPYTNTVIAQLKILIDVKFNRDYF